MAAEVRDISVFDRYASVKSSARAIERIMSLPDSSRGAQLHRFIVAGAEALPYGISVIDPFPGHIGPGKLEIGGTVLTLEAFRVGRPRGGSEYYQLGFSAGYVVTPFKPWTIEEAYGRLSGFDFGYTVVSQFPLGWQLNDMARMMLGQNGIAMPTFDNSHAAISTAGQYYAAQRRLEQFR